MAHSVPLPPAAPAPASTPPPLTEAQAETAAVALVRFVTAVYAEDAGARARIDALIAADRLGDPAPDARLPEAA